MRELDNVVSRAVLRASAGRDLHLPLTLDAHHLDLSLAPRPSGEDQATALPAPRAGMHLRAQLEDVERRIILAAVERHDGNWAAAARALGMHRSNLHQLARRLGLLDQRRPRVARRPPAGNRPAASLEPHLSLAWERSGAPRTDPPITPITPIRRSVRFHGGPRRGSACDAGGAPVHESPTIKRLS